MVKRLVKFAEKTAGEVRNIFFANPKLLFEEERHLIKQPFFWPGLSTGEKENGTKGVLLVHGWTCTPYELRRLGKYLNEKGYTVSGIMLAGHGTVPSDLENVTAQDWIADVEVGYAKLKQTCDKIFVVGTSIGGSLALILAQQEKDVAGLVLMATPYRMRMEMMGAILMKIFRLLGQKNRKKFYPPTFGLSTTITRLISYQSYPVVSVSQVFELVKKARKNLSAITKPVLLMQSTHDHIVSKKSMEEIYARLGCQKKKKIYIHKAYHTFISDIKNEHVFRDILNFLEEN